MNQSLQTSQEHQELPNLDEVQENISLTELNQMKSDFFESHDKEFDIFMYLDSEKKQMIDDFVEIRTFCSDNNLELAEIQKSLHPETIGVFEEMKNKFKSILKQRKSD